MSEVSPTRPTDTCAAPWCVDHQFNPKDPADAGYCNGPAIRVGPVAFSLSNNGPRDGDAPKVFWDEVGNETTAGPYSLQDVLLGAEKLVEHLQAAMRMSSESVAV